MRWAISHGPQLLRPLRFRLRHPLLLLIQLYLYRTLLLLRPRWRRRDILSWILDVIRLRCKSETLQLPKFLQHDQLCEAVITRFISGELHWPGELDRWELREASSAAGIARNAVDHVRVHNGQVSRLPSELLKLSALHDHVRLNIGLDRIRVDTFRMLGEQASNDADGVNAYLGTSGTREYIGVKVTQQEPLLRRVEEVTVLPAVLMPAWGAR